MIIFFYGDMKLFFYVIYEVIFYIFLFKNVKIIHPTVRDGALQFITDHNPITAHLGLNKFIPCNTIINVFADVDRNRYLYNSM